MNALLANTAAIPLTTLLCATCFWIFAEQQLMAPSMSAMAQEFHMTDQEKDEKLGGEVSIGFFIVGGLVGLAVGWAVDSATHIISRTKLFALVVLLGRFGSIGTYMCRSFPELLVCRITTGISIGGASPIVYSLLGDAYPASSRVHIASLVGLSMSFGGACGQVMAAYMAPRVGWRTPFLAATIPAAICVCMLMCISEYKMSAIEKDGVEDAETETGTGFLLGEKMIQNGRVGGVTPSRNALTLDINNHNLNINSGSTGININIKSSPELYETYSDVYDNGYGPYDGDGFIRGGGGGAAISPAKVKSRSGHSSANRSNENLSTLSGLSSPPRPGQGDRQGQQWEYQTPIRRDHCSNNQYAHSHIRNTNGAHFTPSGQTLMTRLKDVLSIPTATLIFVQGIFGCVPWAILTVYFNDFLQHDLRLDVHQSTILMTFFGVGAAVGQVGGGLFGQHLFNRDPRKQVLFIGLSTLCAVIPLLLIVNSNYFTEAAHEPHHHAPHIVDPEHPFFNVRVVTGDARTGPGPYIFFLFTMTGLLAAAVGPNVRSVLQNVTTAKNRGIAFAVNVLCDDVGKGAGPYFVARLIGWTGNRKEAFDIGILNWLISGGLCLVMYRYILSDIRISSTNKKLFSY